MLDAIEEQAAAEGAADAAPDPLIPQATEEQQYPKIVLFSTSWCPHCKMAKEYLVRNKIPFINRDVDEDREALDLLMDKYKSQSVPFFVFGEDAEVMNGFTEERFQKALEKARSKK